jgi:hypothetical protein
MAETSAALTEWMMAGLTVEKMDALMAAWKVGVKAV